MKTINSKKRVNYVINKEENKQKKRNSFKEKISPTLGDCIL